MKIIHASDPHIGKDGALEAFEALLSHIWLHYAPDTTAILLTGDLVDRPRQEHFRALRRCLVDITDKGYRLMAVPGNHDVHANYGVDSGFLSPATYAGWRGYIKPLLGAEELGHGLVQWRIGGRQILGLDTNAGTAHDFKPDLARGAVGKQQLGRLTAALEQGAIVVGHHRVWWDDSAHAMSDRAELHEILDPRAAFYLCGHQHVASDLRRGEVRYIAAPRCTEVRAKGMRFGVLDLETDDTRLCWTKD